MLIGYRTLLRLLYTAKLSDSCLTALFSGYLGCFGDGDGTFSSSLVTSLDPQHMIPSADRFALLALRKMLVSKLDPRRLCIRLISWH